MKAFHSGLVRLFAILSLFIAAALSFAPFSSRQSYSRPSLCRFEEQGTSSFEDTDTASKGFVSVLTSFVNSFSSRSHSNGGDGTKTTQHSQSQPLKAPTSPEELTDRLRKDYEIENYLWTGKLDIACFEDDCTFTDPTISFVGSDKFVENVQNLVPLIEKFVHNDCKSDLLNITLYPEYVETRWNMVGKIKGVFWNPKIDVVGRTKFWYNASEIGEGIGDGDAQTCVRVYSYDEEWEIPAYQALLQLVTPAGTFPNSLLDDT